MQKTTNYGFPKPEDDDFFNVKDFADMMDKVDETLAKVENAGGIYVGGQTFRRKLRLMMKKQNTLF